MRARDFLFWMAVVLTPVPGLALKASDKTSEAFDRAGLVRRAEDAMSENGLVKDFASQALISGIPAAAIYRRPSCDGLLVVVPLPLTAQRFEHVVPSFQENETASGFVFQGRRSEAYPMLSRLVAIISANFHIRTDIDTTVFAFKELGNCGLSLQMDWSKLGGFGG